MTLWTCELCGTENTAMQCYSKKCIAASLVDRSQLLRQAREIFNKLTPEERQQIFTEMKLMEPIEFVKHMTSPAARVGALVGGLLGAALGGSVDAEARKAPAAMQVPKCEHKRVRIFDTNPPAYSCWDCNKRLDPPTSSNK
jgi:hypothetical protein